MNGDRFECEAGGQRMIGHAVDGARPGDGQPAVLLWMGDERGNSIGPQVRAEFSIVALALEGEVTKTELRRRAIVEFKRQRWPERLVQLEREGKTVDVQVMVLGKVGE